MFFLLIIPVGGLLALGTLYGLQRRLVFQPWLGATVAHAETAGLTPVTITAADGIAVRHWYALPRDGHRPVVVLFHGNGGAVMDLAAWAAAFRSRGYGVVLADYRGYTGNPGTPSETGLYADARALLAWLGQQGIDERRTVLLGWSLGTGVAVQMASEHHPRALALLAPFTSLGDAAARHFPMLPARYLLWDRFDNRAKIGEIGAPLIIAHGEADDVIPAELGRRLFDAARQPKRAIFLKNAGHWIDPALAFSEILGFIEALPEASSPVR